MPGMMDTVLNIGLTDAIVENLATGELERFWLDSYRRLLQMMETALARQEQDGVVDLHRAWIDALLAEYYDPIYAFQRESKRSRLLFAGQQTEVVGFLRQYRP